MAVRKLFEKLARGQSTPIKVVFADKSAYQSRDEEPEVTIVFKTRRAERRTALFGYVGFFESHFDGEVDIAGEKPLCTLIRLAYTNAYKYTANPLIAIRRRRLERRQNNRDYARAKANCRAHHGLPVGLFQAMLGETLCYAEGYWPEDTETLDQAQHNRCDYICRKLRLQPGDRLSRSAPAGVTCPCLRRRNTEQTSSTTTWCRSKIP